MKRPSDPSEKKENKLAVYILIALFSPVYVLGNIIECTEIIRKYFPELPGVLMDIFCGRYTIAAAPHMHLSIVFPIITVLGIVGALAGNYPSNK